MVNGCFIFVIKPRDKKINYVRMKFIVFYSKVILLRFFFRSQSLLSVNHFSTSYHN